MLNFLQLGIRTPHILLPDASCELEKWAVIACDQFSSQPAYWENVENYVADAPSTLRMMYPECYLPKGPAPLEKIHDTMASYKESVLTRSCNDFMLIERQTRAGKRLGLIAEIDLEAYDYTDSASTLIRSTEQTILSRLPARVTIREKALVELPHVMLLIDDPEKTVLEPLVNRQNETLYDFDLMMDGGHIKGSRITDETALKALYDSLKALESKGKGMLFAVGDGNHSLAAARDCWLKIRKGLSEEERANHPMRFALVEICNLHGDGMAFEPIHRAVFGKDAVTLFKDFAAWCESKGMTVINCAENDADMVFDGNAIKLENAINPLPVAILQPYLDEWLSVHKDASIDYIHDDDALKQLADKGACCVKLNAIDRKAFFESIRRGGSLPRKTFSMGTARDKRYYLECRSLI